jgi:hypothetical protein
MSSVESNSNPSQANLESRICARSPNAKCWIETLLTPCCTLNRFVYSKISTSHHGLQPLGAQQVQSDIVIYVSKEAEYVTKNDTLLDYYREQSAVESEFDVSLNLRECKHQINNARAKLKDVVMNAMELRSQFEVDLAIAVV